MTLSNFSWPIFAGGLAVLAGVLYALQQLRVRHRQHVVVTTLFWKEAVEESRARVFRQRFRHPLAYLLILAIAALMWFGAAGPKTSSRDGGTIVVLLDGSARMTVGDRFDEAVQRVSSTLKRLPASRTSVEFCGSQYVTLLKPDENPILLQERVRSLQAESSPSSIERRISGLARTASAERPLEIVVVGVTELDDDLLALLPDHVTVTALEHDAESKSSDNGGVTQLGIAPAKSGDWTRMDAIVEVVSKAAPSAVSAQFDVLLDGKPIAPTIEQVTKGTNTDLHVFRIADLPASGGLLTVTLKDRDAILVDNSAEVFLPDRPRIRTFLEAGIPELVRRVIAADPAISIVSDRSEAEVMIASAAPTDSNVPALVFGPEDASHAFFFEFPEDRQSDEMVRRLFYSLGLDQIDAQSLAQATGRVIQLGGEAGQRRRITLWKSLLDPKFDFTANASFPLFIGQSVRWLANRDEPLQHVAAGQRLESRTGLFLQNETRLHAGRQDFEPPAVGRYTSAHGESIAVSLIDEDVSRDMVRSDNKADAPQSAKSQVPLLMTLGILCLGLLLGEWFLFRKGGIP